MESHTPSILVVDSEPDRRRAMREVAEEVGFIVEEADSQKKLLARLRTGLPDILWAGSTLKDAKLAELFGVVRAAYPSLTVLLFVDDNAWEDALDLLEQGAFDVVRDEDDPRIQKTALRRASIDAKARARVKEERGLILGAQSRLTAFAPTTARMLEQLSAAFKEALDRPDISLRKVETICATALSGYFDGVPVVIMALERPAMLLRPRGVSHNLDGHHEAEQRGFVLTPSKEKWREALEAVSENTSVRELVREAYGTRQVFLAPLGPDDEPYGVAAFLPNHAAPPSPEEEDLLRQVTMVAGHGIRIARHVRVLLRRNAPSGGSGPFTNSGV